MGRIFISAGHGNRVNGVTDPGAVVAGTTEAREMILTRDLVVTELRSRGVEVLSVPDALSAAQAIDWINARDRPDDVALEIRADAFSNPAVRGATVYYIANNDQRRRNAEQLLLALIRRVPQLPSRGARPDTDTGLGSLPFTRQITCGSLLMTVGFLTNPDDRFIIQNQRRDLASGIADGLVAWARGTALPPDSTTYPEIRISINGQIYGEKGILVNGNAYIPIDLTDRLGIDLTQDPNIRRLNYRQVVFVKAVDLRNYTISVGWDAQARTVLLRSILKICPGTLDRIMSNGNTTSAQLIAFLRSNNDAAPVQYPQLADLYRSEAAIEGVNYDIAFSQMLLETNYLRFGGEIKPSQNNFAGLGDVGGGPEGASFPNAQTGVRAHIQLLKAYASTEPLVQEVVAPRFRFVTRGIAPLVDQLSGRWSADPQYGAKITAILRRLYEAAQLL
ncbi:N-acetylmuramoyl-L-alanine amidase [Leptolyngbya sp. FACHB-17]|uniref:hormogonium tapered terminus morphoprotein TftA n=1 Tax=unclassified Leptolyngbya TaxID=2650499 RepID=UPI00168003C4|nr:N-acetylmuramoyl-L-alanine amidase [Leptolyngbya sp. FACHB-17]MBD2079423.1 N-acetylmuramoyl-L-alanine amidase [Leptolyngbya sp. FACHB-17]